MNLNILPSGTVLVFTALAVAVSGCAVSTPPKTLSDDRHPGTVSEPAFPSDVRPFYESLDQDDPASDKIGRVIGEEVEKEIATAADKAVATFDIPIVVNARVEKWMNWFQGRGRKVFERWMARSGRYAPMMQEILRTNGLPEDLVYLAMIESGFKPYAYSHAHASGPWQFIRSTGARYGLRVNWWIDERRCPEKSTIAAAQHLKDLYDQFNHWYLAAASYNAGAGKITRAMRKYSTEDFWEMSKSGYRYLKPETKNYVPKMIAAARIAKEPEKYGFTGIVFENPVEYEKVVVTRPTEIAVIERVLGLQNGTLARLNPELRRGITPPDADEYELKVPMNYAERYAAAANDISRHALSSVHRHVVKKGDTLGGIARRYGTSHRAIMSFNRLTSTRIRIGQHLAIPVVSPTRPSRGEKATSVASSAQPRGDRVQYSVVRGDTLWSISRKFGVSVRQLRNWNVNAIRGNTIRPGQRLVVYRPAARSKTVVPAVREERKAETAWHDYSVRRGDTLWDISRRFNVSLADLKEWNRIAANGRIVAGQKLKIRAVGL